MTGQFSRGLEVKVPLTKRRRVSEEVGSQKAIRSCVDWPVGIMRFHAEAVTAMSLMAQKAMSDVVLTDCSIPRARPTSDLTTNSSKKNLIMILRIL